MRPFAQSLLLWCALAPAFAAQPPILDRELFFGDPKISGAQLSPDGQYISFMKPWNKTRNLGVKRTEEAFSAAKLVTADTKRPIPGYFWSRDSKYILFVQDQAGDENYNVYAANPAERLTAWIFDLKDQLRLAARSAENGDTEILRVDANGFTKIYSCDVLETCAPVRFHQDHQRFYLITNKGADADLTSLQLFDPATRQATPCESDPRKKVDFGGARFSEVTDQIIATFYDDERLRVYFKDPSFESDYQWLRSKLPGKDFRFGSATRDERLWLVPAFSDTEPGETYLFERKTRRLTLQYRIREKLLREHLASMQPIRYQSSDGLEIPAYLTLPKGLPAKNLPLMMVPHGGPWGRDSWGYSAFAQFLANRGYAVLSPNFRGSAGYGKKFINAGNQQWGDKMQDDITWGVKHLVAQGVAAPKRVGILGGSYGGYATLAGVAFTPDVYAAAVSIVGPSNLLTLLESIPPYWEMIRKMFHVRMGDPTTPQGKKQLERQSPLNSAQRIQTPLMVIQGANDPRVNKAESDQIVIALRDRGFPVEYLVASDEGHGFARPVNNMACFAAAEKFLAKYLGGRYQEDMPAEVAQRLKEISVDPKTVVLARKLEAASVGAPKPATDLTPGTYRYKATLQMGANSMNLELTTTIKAESGAWTVTDTTQTPGGEAIDTAVLEKGTLILRRRSLRQGPAAIDVEFKDHQATGSMKISAQERPINADLGGPLFADAAGSAFSIACLPLGDGYSTAFRNFDVRKQKPKLMQLKVAGVEKVTVPAGAFDAFKVEISSAEGGPEKVTMWIARDSRKPVKISASMPEMGGATLTVELTQ